jgi:hypothetical protein
MREASPHVLGLSVITVAEAHPHTSPWLARGAGAHAAGTNLAAVIRRIEGNGSADENPRRSEAGRGLISTL